MNNTEQIQRLEQKARAAILSAYQSSADENYRIDFTLPEAVTQYVLCVELDRDESLVGISMES